MVRNFGIGPNFSGILIVSIPLNLSVHIRFNLSNYFKDEFVASLDSKIGQMGSIMVIAGLFGSIVGGLALDKFRRIECTSTVLILNYLFEIEWVNNWFRTWCKMCSNLLITSKTEGLSILTFSFYLPINYTQICSFVKRYKLTTLITYAFSLTFMVVFTWGVDLESITLDFALIAILG